MSSDIKAKIFSNLLKNSSGLILRSLRILSLAKLEEILCYRAFSRRFKPLWQSLIKLDHLGLCANSQKV